MATAPAKPLVTANQVTFLRLALIPIPCWLLYQGERGQFAALIFATILGCTDFVDGYLARKYGPTKLGGLMDPIADKVFIAITFLPAVDLRWAPAWLVGLLFVREFLVTAARTAYEARGQSLKSSYVARYKTWVQMCGVGMLMLFHTVSERAISIGLAVGALAPLAFFLLRLLVARKRWKGATWFAISFGVLFAVHRVLGSAGTNTALMYFIVGITWWSGLGYLSGVGTLKGKGAITGGELVRLVTSIALPLLVVTAQTADAAPKWAIITVVCLELAHGGLDNLLAGQRAHQGGVGWGLRTFGECALLGATLFAQPPLSAWAAYGAAALATAGIVIAFAQKRSYYLDPPKNLPATITV